MDSVEEKVAEMRGEVHREMEFVRSELQHLVPLEKNVETLLGRMTVLDRMDRWLQKVEESDLLGSSSGVKATSSGPEILDRGKAVVMEASDPPSSVISGAIGQGSGGSGAPEAPSEEATKADRRIESWRCRSLRVGIRRGGFSGRNIILRSTAWARRRSWRQ